MLTDRELLLAPVAPLAPVRSHSWSRSLQRIAFWCIILNIAVGAIVAGLVVRRWAWEQTETVRFTSDLDNAFLQGTETLRQGYLARYTNQAGNVEGEYDFDYAPGRLLIATLWTRWVRLDVDGPGASPMYARDWGRFYENLDDSQTYRFLRPLLTANTVGEILSAVAMFLLVRQWTSGSAKPGILRWPQTRPVRSAVLGLIAALFFWFNPALIWNAHCWPQWDSWVLPFFLWGLVFASANYWFCAGMLVAAGAMFKAQILFGAPLFVLWPLWRGQMASVCRWVIGAAITAAVITSGWLLRTDDQFNTRALMWVLGTGVSIPLVWLAIKSKWEWFVKVPLAVVALLIVTWPLHHMGWKWNGAFILAVVGLAAVIRYAPKRALIYAVPAWIAAALFVCVPVFNGSMSWFQVGIAFGTHRYMMMTRGSVNNLAGILEAQWHWSSPMDPAVTIPAGHFANVLGSIMSGADSRVSFLTDQPFDIPLKYLLFGVYILGMILSSLGAAIQSKRGNPRFLVAITAPWLVFFAVMTQMHQRYLLWGATLSAATVVLGPGFALLHLFLTTVAWSQEAVDMMRHANMDSTIYLIISGWTPGLGWAVLLVTAIFVYVGVAPGRRVAQLD